MDYEGIRSIVSNGIKLGLISEPNPMKRHSVSKKTARKIYQRNSPKMEICKARRDELLSWYNQGMSKSDIAKKIGISNRPLTRFFQSEGIYFKVGVYKRNPDKKYGRPKVS